MVHALTNQNYRALWLAACFWYTARWTELFLLALLVLDITDSVFWVGLATFLRIIPLPILGIPLGRIADRVNRKKMLTVVQAVQFSGMLLTGLFLLADIMSLWWIVAVTLVMGTGWAGDYTSRRPLTHDIMGQEQITGAMSLDLVALFGGRFIGPFTGGFVAVQFGLSQAYLMVATFYLLGLFFLYFVKVVHDPASKDKLKNNQPPIKSALKYILTTKHLIGALLASVILNTFIAPYAQFIPVIAEETLNVSQVLAGMLVSAEGLGALIGCLVFVSRPKINYHGRYFLFGMLGFCTAILLFSLSSNYFIALAFVGISGLALSGYAIMQFTLMLVFPPKSMQGFAVGAMLFAQGTWSIGNLEVGVIASFIGANNAMAISAGTGLLLGLLVFLLVPELRKQTSEILRKEHSISNTPRY